MKSLYFEAITMIERLHYVFMEVLDRDLIRMEAPEVTSVQALLLYNIGTSQLTVGDLTQRGYYLGSNVSYNLKKMVQAHYLEQISSLHDRRLSYVKLSKKGLDLYAKLDTALEQQAHLLHQEGLNNQNLAPFCQTLHALSDFWTERLTH